MSSILDLFRGVSNPNISGEIAGDRLIVTDKKTGHIAAVIVRPNEKYQLEVQSESGRVLCQTNVPVVAKGFVMSFFDKFK